MKISRGLLWIAGLLIAIGVVAALKSHRGDRNEYLTATLERGAIRDVVEATGPIKAIVLVQVGSQVSGTISKLNVDFNSHVHRGDVVATIDPALFEGALRQALADLDSAKASVGVAKQNVLKAKAALVQARLDYQRAVQITQAHFQPQQFLDQAQATLDASQAEVAATEAAVVQAEAQARQKAAAVAVAKTNLDYTVIRSPIDGTVVARNVDVGQTVAASLQAPDMFEIALDLRKMQLHARTDESEIGRIKAGQPVTFKVDAFPKETFPGIVREVRMNATTVQNVVTYDTVIDFENPDLKLFPSMTAYVTIPVASVDNALKVPNTALRFEPPLPPEEIRKLYAIHHLQWTASSSDSSDARPSATEKSSRNETAVVWKLQEEHTLEPVRIGLGVTDHAYTEVTAILGGGPLNVGDAIVTGFVPRKTASAPGTLR